ncbi:hypothetical protein C0992_002117 [Termitomyces sp. T32_za158]|nr:hypothetical protein C0992_002117 [Termitomyces sp. T32_za158]
MSYFSKHWSKDLQAEVLIWAEVFQEQFLHFKGSEDSKRKATLKASTNRLNILLREIRDDENDEDMSDLNLVQNHVSNRAEDLKRPWLQYFNEYIDSQDKVPESAAWAKPSRGQAGIGGLGSAQGLSEPEPPQARPSRRLLGQAGPEHH